ncbi:hypothetical protein [Flavobacterium coralii]|uniref:hypothetical protein n=1 Tax=Flavobacterium coralii TaxID=2838017 RepID=UPI000C3C3E67|nr:hypothetical protein [Flavobacterium sp.]|tara:strand:+ start:5486 stop:6133 length:648 start_codon:yes stop_codon:yes gene_type:complete
MNKTNYKNLFDEYVEKNFDNIHKFLNIKLTIFREIQSRIHEISICLIVEAYTASVTLSNHTLERLLKLALIKNEILQTGKIGIDKIDYKTPHKNWDGLVLDKTVKACKENKLITEEEYKTLNEIRRYFRNGYSHGELNKILYQYKEEVEMFKVNINTDEVQPLKINLKETPIWQYILVDEFSKEIAIQYLDFLCILTQNIEQRIHQKRQDLKLRS